MRNQRKQRKQRDQRKQRKQRNERTQRKFMKGTIRAVIYIGEFAINMFKTTTFSIL